MEKQYRDETLTSTHVQHVAYRKDGSSVVAMYGTVVDGTPSELRQITDLSVPGFRSTNSVTKSVTTMPFSDARLESERRKVQSCSKPKGDAVWTEMSGFDVVYQVRESRDMGNGQMFPGFERWLAPELGCAVLKEILVLHGTNITLGDPDPALFAVPADYVESSPAQMRPRVSPKEEVCPSEDAECLRSARMRREMELRIENNYWRAQTLKETTD